MSDTIPTDPESPEEEILEETVEEEPTEPEPEPEPEPTPAPEPERIPINIVIDENALREQVTSAVNDVMSEASEKLINAAWALNPVWLEQRDEALKAQAIAEFKATRGITD